MEIKMLRQEKAAIHLLKKLREACKKPAFFSTNRGFYRTETEEEG